jgi:DNA-binding LytR/AlgR family response regulator
MADEINRTREIICNLETKLASKNFPRIHRSYIANLNKAQYHDSEFLEIGKKQFL